MTKPAELRALSAEDLQERLEEAQEELFSLRSQQATVQMENPARFGILFSEIARIKTILHEKALGITS
ncbi:MAG: 50S ribosomal protein L29 [Chloroflexi bacterium]|nr:50S ribosomal protein L29 [Chloroflexota bacterium]